MKLSKIIVCAPAVVCDIGWEPGGAGGVPTPIILLRCNFAHVLCVCEAIEMKTCRVVVFEPGKLRYRLWGRSWNVCVGVRRVFTLIE